VHIKSLHIIIIIINNIIIIIVLSRLCTIKASRDIADEYAGAAAAHPRLELAPGFSG